VGKRRKPPPPPPPQQQQQQSVVVSIEFSPFARGRGKGGGGEEVPIPTYTYTPLSLSPFPPTPTSNLASLFFASWVDQVTRGSVIKGDVKRRRRRKKGGEDKKTRTGGRKGGRGAGNKRGESEAKTRHGRGLSYILKHTPQDTKWPPPRARRTHEAQVSFFFCHFG
jgi:hypothetical protein